MSPPSKSEKGEESAMEEPGIFRDSLETENECPGRGTRSVSLWDQGNNGSGQTLRSGKVRT